MDTSNIGINLSKAIDLFFPSSSSFELVYFEAVANAMDAGATKISIDISIESYSKPESLTVVISDNGIGFTDERYTKFTKLLETDEEGHKGLGRLVFLKNFNRVDVTSNYETKTRKFIFERSFNKDMFQINDNNTIKTGTTLTFSRYVKKKINSYDFLRPTSIKQRLFYHFYPHFFNLVKQKKEVEIIISLATNVPNTNQLFYNDKQRLIASEITNLESREFKVDGLNLFNDTICIFYKVEQTFKASTLVTAICVEGRTIPIDIMSLDSIPDGYEVIFLLYSDFFTGKANPSREELSIDEQELKTVKNIFRNKATVILNEKIPMITEENQRINKSLSERYPHLNGYFETQSIGIINRNIAIEVAQKKFFQAQKEILDSPDNISPEQYEKAINVSSRTLMEYILYRNVIIKNLQALDFKSKEANIHNLIIPQKKICHKEAIQEDLYTNNAWLLDDKYMSYSSILSDQEMDKLLPFIKIPEDDIEANDKRPDIAIVFSDDINKAEKVDVVIIELKRRFAGVNRNTEILTQLRDRARKLGKFYPDKIQRMWFYGVADIDQEFREFLSDDFTPLFSKGSVYYKEQKVTIDEEKDLKLPVGLFIMSFDSLLKDADIRNQTFLNLLKTTFQNTLNRTE